MKHGVDAFVPLGVDNQLVGRFSLDYEGVVKGVVSVLCAPPRPSVLSVDGATGRNLIPLQCTDERFEDRGGFASKRGRGLVGHDQPAANAGANTPPAAPVLKQIIEPNIRIIIVCQG